MMSIKTLRKEMQAQIGIEGGNPKQEELLLVARVRLGEIERLIKQTSIVLGAFEMNGRVSFDAGSYKAWQLMFDAFKEQLEG